MHAWLLFRVSIYGHLITQLSRNSNPKTRVYRQPKPGFSGLKKTRVTRVFGFGKTRVGNPSTIGMLISREPEVEVILLVKLHAIIFALVCYLRYGHRSLWLAPITSSMLCYAMLACNCNCTLCYVMLCYSVKLRYLRKHRRPFVTH